MKAPGVRSKGHLRPVQQPSETDLMMALATMKKLGRIPEAPQSQAFPNPTGPVSGDPIGS